jgi:hypothetical protein
LNFEFHSWRIPDALDGLVDAHMPHPGFSDENWVSVRKLTGMVLERSGRASKNEMSSVDEYKRAFDAGFNE